MKKIFKKLHLWLSLPFGIIIAIICITGSILVFEKELLELCYPSRYFVEEVKADPLPVATLLRSARQNLPDSVEIKSITIPADPKRTYQLATPARGVNYFIDPYTSELTAFQNGRDPFFLTTMRLHRWLLGEYKRDGSFSLGKTVVGISTIIMIVILISGFFIWFPRTTKGLKPRLSININRGWLRFFHDLHVAGGFYTVSLLLVLALTGLTWSFGWYRSAFYALFGVESVATAHAAPPLRSSDAASESPSINASPAKDTDKPKQGKGNPSGDKGSRPQGSGRPTDANPHKTSANPNTIQWNKALANIKSVYPVYRSIVLEDGSATVSTSSYGNTRAADRISFNKNTGEIQSIELYSGQPKSSKIRGWIYSVHVGSWGGLTTRLITCLVSLLGSIFVFTGYYFWWKKRKK